MIWCIGNWHLNLQQADVHCCASEQQEGTLK
jgi:hypothetical protein